MVWGWVFFASVKNAEKFVIASKSKDLCGNLSGIITFSILFFLLFGLPRPFLFFAMAIDLRYFVVSFKYDKTAVVFIVIFCGKYGLVWFGD